MKTIGEIVKVAASLVPATRTSTTSSETVVDTKGFENVCWVVAVGDIDTTNENETYVAAVYESDNSNGSSASAISGATATITADNQIAKIQVNSLGTGSKKRYQFCRLTLGGTTPSAPSVALALLGPAAFGPAQDPDASV